MGKIKLDHFEIFAESIELAQMPLDDEALVLGHDLLWQATRGRRVHTNPDEVRRYQVRMQDQLDDILSYNLFAASNLPAQRLRYVIGDPHLGRKPLAQS